MASRKKIFDITPPEKTIEIKKPLVEQLLPAKPPSPRPSFYFKKSFLIKKPILIVAGVLLVGVFGFVFIKPEAEIEIWPVKETVEFKTQFSSVGEVMTQTHLTSKDFASTGKITKTEKAEGVIRVYNNYQLSQTLVQNTRFWCFEGDTPKEFKTKQRVVIPSQEQLDVQVIASSAGEEYNIGPCTFSIPGLKGSPRYTMVYGKSFLAMTGGAKTETTIVSREDLDKAEEEVTEKALAESRTALKNLISSEEYVLVEEAIETAIIEVNPLTEVGKQVDNFIFQVKAEAKALVFKKAELEKFAKAHAQSKIPEGKELVEDSLAIGYFPKTVDFSLREMVLDLELSAEIYRILDESSVKESLKNIRRGSDDVMSALRKFPEIARAKARIWPFWTQIIPNDASRIKIKLNLD